MKRAWAVGLLPLVLSCGSYDPHDHVVAPSVTTFSVAPRNALADGSGLVMLTCVVPATATDKAVTFNALGATFAGTTANSVKVAADPSGVATAYLRAPRVSGTVRVWSVTSVTTVVDSVIFDRAYPTRLALEPDKFVVTGSTGETSITVSLGRIVGMPSDGLVLSAAARDTLGASQGQLGALLPSTSTEAGATAKVRWSVAGSPYRGRVTIVVSSPSDGTGGVLVDSVRIVVSQ